MLSIKRRPEVAAALLVAAGVAVPAVMMIYGSTTLDITYKGWTWFALPLTAGLTLGSATVAARRPMIGGLLLMISCAPAATIFWRELGFFTFGGAWLLGAWIYFAQARQVLKSSPAVAVAVEVAHSETTDRGARATEGTPIPRG